MINKLSQLIKKLKFIIGISFAVHIVILFINIDTYWNAGLLSYHIGIAKNVAEKGNLFQSADWASKINEHQNLDYLLIEPEVYANIGNAGEAYPAYERNPGYGFLLGSTWFISGSYTYYIIRILQIIVNSFFIIFVYLLFNQLFNNDKISIVAASAYAICTPISFLASYPSEEIFAIWFCLLFLLIFLSNLSLKNILMASIFLGIGSYFHELPHTLSKYLCLLVPIYVFFVQENKMKIRDKLNHSLLAGIIVFIVPIIILSPYIVRNYIHFGRYIETRYWGTKGLIEEMGEFDSSFAYLDDIKVDKMIMEKIKKENLNIDKKNPAYFDVLNDYYYDYLRKNPLIVYKNAFKRIPKLLKARQFYGIESLGAYREISLKAYNEEQNGGKYSTIDYMKKNLISYTTIIEIIKFLFDNILLMIVTNIVILFNIYKNKNPKLIFLSFLMFLIYGGNLIHHVEPKYFLLSYLFTFMFFIIFAYNYVKTKEIIIKCVE